MEMITYGVLPCVTVFAGTCKGGPYDGSYLEYHHVVFPVRVDAFDRTKDRQIRHGYYRARQGTGGDGDWEWIAPKKTTT